MSAAEIYDYVPLATPDYNYTLTLKAQGEITEEGYKNQVIRRADDNSREVATISSGSIFFVSFDWKLLNESDSGTIFDLYHNAAKANGMARSFRWGSLYDGHTYVVCFSGPLTRRGNAVSRWGIPQVKFEIIGKISD